MHKKQTQRLRRCCGSFVCSYCYRCPTCEPNIECNYFRNRTYNEYWHTPYAKQTSKPNLMKASDTNDVP